MPIDSTTIVLLRHGQSVGNLIDQQLIKDDATDFPLDLLSRGDAEWPLTDLGLQQAERAGSYLRSAFPGGFDHIFCSPFIRSQQTLAALQIGKGLLEPRIKEQNWGALNGPEMLLKIDERHTFERAYASNIDLRPPEGETVREVHARLLSFWSERQSLITSRKTLIVSHWAPLFLSRMILNKLPLTDFPSAYMLKREVLNCQIDMYSSQINSSGGPAGWWARSTCLEHDSHASYPWQQMHDRQTLV